MQATEKSRDLVVCPHGLLVSMGLGKGGWLPEGSVTTKQLASGPALTNRDISNRVSQPT